MRRQREDQLTALLLKRLKKGITEQETAEPDHKTGVQGTTYSTANYTKVSSEL